MWKLMLVVVFLIVTVAAEATRGSSGLPRSVEPTGRTSFVFNPNILRWAAYDEDGNLVKVGRGSAGRKYCPDIGRGCKSPQGVFHVVSKEGANCHSTRYPRPRGGAPMPYAMFFSKYYAIHGSNDVPNYNASHGCVRVQPSDAEWLNHHFLSVGSRVTIYNY
jgi:lipoprotein-anchoring transpeptidase ErfK/SrfK